MHATLPWLLAALALLGVGVWRFVVSSRRAREMRAAREQAMAIALAEAQRAAREAAARRQADAPAAPPAVTRTVVRAPAPAPIATRPAPAAAEPALTDAQVAARAEAHRIALEAARRAKAQKAARVEAERRADAAPAAPQPEPPPAAGPAAITRLVARPARPEVAPVPAPAPVAAPPAPVAAKSPAETVILMVDDSKMVRIKTSRLLEAHDYRVVTAVDGQDALRQLQAQRPDLVITDVDMPNMDGFGLARHLRADAATAQIPIVMITSAEDRHRAEAHAVGVGLVLGKPYPEDALIAHIRSFRFAATPA